MIVIIIINNHNSECIVIIHCYIVKKYYTLIMIIQLFINCIFYNFFGGGGCLLFGKNFDIYGCYDGVLGDIPFIYVRYCMYSMSCSVWDLNVFHILWCLLRQCNVFCISKMNKHYLNTNFLEL